MQSCSRCGAVSHRAGCTPELLPDIPSGAGSAGASGYTPSAAIPLGRKAGIGLQQSPMTGGLATSQDGSVLAVANTLNDSIPIVNTATNAISFEYGLRPLSTPARSNPHP